MPAQKAINTEPKMCVLFVLAFGTPRPFHRAAIHNWSRVTSTRFILITDTPDAWSQLSAGMDNIGIIPISIDDYFASFYSFFNVADKQAFIAEFGHAFFNACTGWTACGLRPLLRLLLGTSEYPEPLWGWMDYDILLDSERFERWIKPCARGDVGACLFAHTGIVWEQCKVFRNEFNILQHYETVLLTDPMLAMLPMEARLCQFIRNQGAVEFEDFPADELCAHWKYSDALAQAAPNRFEVRAVEPARLVHAMNGRPVGVFLADTECKIFTEAETDAVMQAWHEGRAFAFPHRAVPA